MQQLPKQSHLVSGAIGKQLAKITRKLGAAGYYPWVSNWIVEVPLLFVEVGKQSASTSVKHAGVLARGFGYLFDTNKTHLFVHTTGITESTKIRVFA